MIFPVLANRSIRTEGTPVGGAGSGKKRTNTRDRKMVRLRDQGLTLREIARRIGVSRQAVLVALDRQGLSPARQT